MKTSLLNLPTYIITIFIRKLLDIHTGSTTHKVMARGPWIVDDVINSENIYIYIIGATLAFFVANIKKGLIDHFLAKYQARTQGRSKYITQRKWLQRNNSWLLKNLLGNRENQQKAISLLSAQIPLSTDHIDVDKHILMESMKKETKNTNAGEGCSKEPQLKDNPLEKAVESRGGIQEDSKTSFYSVIDDMTSNYKPDNNDKTGYINLCDCKGCEEKDDTSKDNKERGDGESRKMFMFDSRSTTPELFTSSVIREIIPSDGSEDDIPKIRLPVKRKMRKTKKDFRWKLPQRPIHATVRRTRSGRVYNFGYRD